MGVQVASVEDIPQLLNLVHSAYREEGSKRGWTTEADLLDGTRTSAEVLQSQIERKNSSILKYLDFDNFTQPRIIGCVQVEKTEQKQGESKCHVGLLTVSPELQAKGIGKKLLAAVHEWAIENGCLALTIRVISARTELIAWYERHGFKPTGEILPVFSHPTFGIPKQELEFHGFEKKLSGNV